MIVFRSPGVQRVLFLVVPFLVVAAVWQLLTTADLVDPFLISSPVDVFPALWEQITSGTLLTALRVTLVEFLVSFGLAAVVGITLGVLMGWYEKVEYTLDPFVWLIFSAPIVSLYPVFLLIFGLGTPTIIAIAFLLTVSTVIVNTMRGVAQVDPKLIQAARAFLANDRQIFRYVAIPGAVPLIMAGLRIGVGRALTGVIVAEFFVGEAGLGYQAVFYAGRQLTADMLASIVVIAALGVLATQLLRMAESRVDRWRVDSHH